MSKILEINRSSNGDGLYLPFLKIWSIDFFGFFIDLRKWYKLMTPREKKKGMKWKDVTIWFCEYEIQDMEKESTYPKKYLRKRIAFLHSSHLWNLSIEKPAFIWIACISFIIGCYIGGLK